MVSQNQVFRQIVCYLAELFRQIVCYLAELFRQIVCYLAELFRQIAFPFKKFWLRHILEEICSLQKLGQEIRKVIKEIKTDN